MPSQSVHARKNNVDTSKTINCVEWFFGYGGNHIGLERCINNLRLVAVCEIEEFAVENILAKMEEGYLEAAPIWSDCRSFPIEPFEDRIDLFVASYPCQPFSIAGKRGSEKDPRHLWPYVLRWLLRARPMVCFFENVEGHITLGLSTVISDLEEAGYEVEAGIFSAEQVGAPHKRKRVFIMGRLKGDYSGWIKQSESRQVWPSRPRDRQYSWEPPRVLVNAEHDGLATSEISGGLESPASEQPQGQEESWNAQGASRPTSPELGYPSKQGCQGSGGSHAGEGAILGSSKPNGSGERRNVEQEQWAVKPSLGGDSNGSSSGVDYAELSVSCDNRIDELRLLGNGVVPQTCELAFTTLWNQLTQKHK